MTIVSRLSSRISDRTAAGNRQVAAECLNTPEHLPEIASNLSGSDPLLVGDCAEVLTLVAERCPELVAPHAARLAPLLRHKVTRVRWEAAHALALAAPLSPGVVEQLLPRLQEIIRQDPSIIVRDYSIDVAGNYAAAGSQAARLAYPLLREALAVWGGRHAGHALAGLRNVASHAPEFAAEARGLGQPFLDDKRAVVRKAAKALVKA